tara:strand:+ start:80 stop:436 length:357 start_codon:yes stop_codon:yes gene_type:complete
MATEINTSIDNVDNIKELIAESTGYLAGQEVEGQPPTTTLARKVALVDDISVRTSTNGIVNIPKTIFKELGWKINDKVEVHVVENHTDTDIFLSVAIDRIEDLEKYVSNEDRGIEDDE